MSSEKAYVHYGDWDSDSDSHPAMDWMHKYTNMIDRKVFDSEPWADWHTDDFVFIKSDGQIFKGGQSAWDALGQVYGEGYLHPRS